ncbi:MAG: hypothetical protein LBU51_11535, partial [Bacteroidales bacterium]|nr:hypothetical protein [Bacteroidales bacterium]
AASLYWNIVAICYFSILALYFLIALLITYKRKLLFKSRLKIVLAFFTLHVAYGFGYVLGVGDFVISHLQPIRKMGSATR